MGMSCGSINRNKFTPVHLNTTILSFQLQLVLHTNILYTFLKHNYLFFCFQRLWVYFVHEVGLCADIVVSFILDKAHICIVTWLCGKREMTCSHMQNIFRPLQSEPKISHSLGSSKRERKRWKKFLHGSGMAIVPNSDTIMRLCSRFSL